MLFVKFRWDVFRKQPAKLAIRGKIEKVSEDEEDNFIDRVEEFFGYLYGALYGRGR